MFVRAVQINVVNGYKKKLLVDNLNEELFYYSSLDNSNSDNSNSPLTRTKFSFPWSKFHWNLPWYLEFPANSNCFSFPSEFELLGVLKYFIRND